LEETVGEPGYPGILESVLFESYGEKLLGRVFVAQGKGPHPTVLLLHGFPGTELNFDIAHEVRRHGWNVFLPHYRGSWGMPGTYSFFKVLDDVSSAIRYLRSPEYAHAFRGKADPLVVIGHSLGGFAAMFAGAADPGITAVGCIAAFNFGAFSASVSGDAKAITDAEKAWEGCMFPLKGVTSRELVREVLDQGTNWDLRKCTHALIGRPVLLIAGTRDDIAPPPLHHAPLCANFQTFNVSNLTAVTCEADHGFTEVRSELCRTLTQWLERI
jgi:uncharacterized protein